VLTKKIREIWEIPRKIYWLQVNGKHESLITSWPQVSTVEIRIKGPAGGDPDADWEDDDVHDPSDPEDLPAPSREKFPKGWIKIGISGLIYKVHTSLTIEQVADKYGFQAGYEYWLPNRRRSPREENHFIDETIPGETGRRLKKMGPVILKVDGSPITVLNNQTFEEELTRLDIELQTDFILLPNGPRLNAREDRIRQFIGMNIDTETEIRWDPRKLVAPDPVIKDEIAPEEGCPNLAKEMKDCDPDDEVISPIPLEPRKKAEESGPKPRILGIREEPSVEAPPESRNLPSPMV
jgi:hypothetical protein